MKGKEYTVDQIRVLDAQLAIKKVLRKYDLIYVSDVDFEGIQRVLMNNDITYTSIRDSELKTSTLIIV